MAKKKYHVTKGEDGNWRGKQEGSSRASVVGGIKKETMQKTIELAKKQDDAQVIIHKKDGKFQEECTYGKDPYPPKG